VHDLHLHFLRWGPALYKTFVGPRHYQWDWVDDVLAEIRRLHIDPILNLCHFGVPDRLGNFQVKTSRAIMPRMPRSSPSVAGIAQEADVQTHCRRFFRLRSLTIAAETTEHENS
jgi:hypothetical protein